MVRIMRVNPIGFLFTARFIIIKIQSDGIYTVAHTARFGAVFKNVSQVCSAGRANNLGTDHVQAGILFFLDVFVVQGGRETGPARAGVKFGLGTEQRVSAGRTFIYSRPFMVAVLTGKGHFSSLITHDCVLFRCQPALPLLFAARSIFYQQILLVPVPSQYTQSGGSIALILTQYAELAPNGWSRSVGKKRMICNYQSLVVY